MGMLKKQNSTVAVIPQPYYTEYRLPKGRSKSDIFTLQAKLGQTQRGLH